MPKLTKRQLAAILFSLRELQMEIITIPHDELDYGEQADGAPLTVDEIDELCELLNS